MKHKNKNAEYIFINIDVTILIKQYLLNLIKLEVSKYKFELIIN